MNTTSLKDAVTTLLLIALALIARSAYSQDNLTQLNTARVTINGTSTIHDWKMISSDVSCSAAFEANASGEIAKLTALQVTLPAESLKSGKSGMDKNAYSALKTDKHKTIKFQLTSAKVEDDNIQCQGKLTIAGVSKNIAITAAYQSLQGGKIQATGSIQLLMTDFGVEPPTFMFGSVTTGNQITVSFEATITPSKANTVTLN